MPSTDRNLTFAPERHPQMKADDTAMVSRIRGHAGRQGVSRGKYPLCGADAARVVNNAEVDSTAYCSRKIAGPVRKAWSVALRLPVSSHSCTAVLAPGQEP